MAELGAHEVIAPEGFEEHGPFDVILELVGAPNLAREPRGADHVGPDHASSGSAPAPRPSSTSGWPCGSARGSCGSTLRARPLEEKALTARAMERSVLPLLASGAVRVPIAATYPLEEAPAAYERFAEGGKLGKIVL